MVFPIRRSKKRSDMSYHSGVTLGSSLVIFYDPMSWIVFILGYIFMINILSVGDDLL